MDSISIEAFAKINLGLKILGRREDGYHEIETTLQTISLADSLRISKSSTSGIRLHVEPNLGISLEENLAYRAAKLFLAHARIVDQGVEIELTKRIPAGTGLGGGSSDAAAALHALNSLFETDLSTEQLMALGFEIGSDVPFFGRGGEATASGRGERLMFLGSTKCSENVVVLAPQVRLSTQRVYEKWDTLTERQRLRDDAAATHHLRNDLEAAALELEPALAECLEFVKAHATGPFGMSGSGSAWFALFEDAADAKSVIELAESALNCKAYLTKPVPYGSLIIAE